MWVKIADNRYINTDHIWIVSIFENEAKLFFGATRDYEIKTSVDAANYLLACVDVQAAQETLSPTLFSASLKTKIAQALRFDYPSGLTKANIHELFFSNANNSTEIDVALGELLAERVVIQPEGYPKTYQHATHAAPPAPSTPSPDPSTATVDS